MRFACPAVLLAAAFVAGCTAPAGRDSLDATPGRLPKTVVPTHYAIELRPDLQSLALPGSEIVDIEVRETTDRVVLNALDMTITAADLVDESGQRARIAVDPQAQTATLAFPKPLAAGAHKLRIAFTGRINRFGRGLFYVDYPAAGGSKRMLSSHNEPADARRIFPGWDEPAFKASFALTVTIPANFLAVSNMPVAREEPDGGAAKRVTFAPTPKMSSYLFVLCAGELERRTVEVSGTTLGVVATSGKSAQGAYALAVASELLAYYNAYFGTPYPLPKLDLIAVPGGFGGAMENWGGITFFESRLLFDPVVNPESAKRGIFNIIAHEMAHLWFGDLVTTSWWDNLWLNEGFASWMQAKAADDLHPDWQTWINTAGAKQYAMGEDARRLSHPIQQKVASESEAMTVFDSITYSKGQALLRMLEDYLGADPFRAGIRRYMAGHAYGSATTADLWQALEQASGKAIAAIAARFTEQPGVPLIVVRASCEGSSSRLALRQERFSIHDPEAAALRWLIPVKYGSPGGAGGTPLLDGIADVDGGACGDPVKLNLGDIGYYRVEYDGETQAALTRDIEQFKPVDRVNLLGDAWALVEAGRAKPAGLLNLIDAVAGDDSRAVAERVIAILTRIDFFEHRRPGRAAWQRFARTRLRPLFDRLGWDKRPGEQEDHTLLRPRLIEALGDLGDSAILAEANRRFAELARNRSTVAPELRGPMIHLVGRTANRVTYGRLLALARRSVNTEERVRYFTALAAARDPRLAERTLALTLTDEVPPSLTGRLLFAVAGNGEHPEIAWRFVQRNLDALVARQGPGFRDYAAASVLGNFTERERAAELAAFAPAHATSGGRIVAARVEELIAGSAEFCERGLPGIDLWVNKHRAR